jgi:hypothetical protein
VNYWSVLLVLWLTPTILALALLLLVRARKAVAVGLARSSLPAEREPIVKLPDSNPAAEAGEVGLAYSGRLTQIDDGEAS